MRIELPLLGMIQVWLQDQELETFSKRQFFNFIMDENESSIYKEYVVIRTELNYDDYLREYSEGRIQYSRNFKSENGNILYNGMRICSEMHGKIAIIIEKQDSLRSKIWRELCLRWYKEKNYARYHALFYQNILFPIFSLYTIFDNYYLIHGSLLKYEKRFILLSGLDGVGKSTLTNMLVEEGAECLADNFVLFNGMETVPLSLALRISPNLHTTMKVIYKDPNLKEVVANNSVVKEKIVPDKVYLLSISDEFRVQRVEHNMFDWLLFMNNAPEIDEANKFISPFLLKRNRKKKIRQEIDLITLEIPQGQLEKGRRLILDECKTVCT